MREPRRPLSAMPAPNSLEATTPALSIQLLNFSAKDPGRGGWRSLLAQARACDEAGIDRVVASDHVVMGENLEEYGNPKVGGTKGGQQPTGPDGQWLDGKAAQAPTSPGKPITGFFANHEPWEEPGDLDEAKVGGSSRGEVSGALGSVLGIRTRRH